MLRFFKKKDLLRELEDKRSQCLKCPLPTALQQNLMQPLPDKNTLFEALSFLVVDFETTGFAVESNDIISIGWVEISKMQVDFASQQHLYINNGEHINHDTAIINHIVPEMVSHGVTLEAAINTLLEHSKNKILVVHGKTIEKRFVDFYAQNQLGIPEIPLIWIDTLIIEKWHLMKMGDQYRPDNRLSSVRKRYNLPQYTAHNALIDSIAAAELLLAQMAHIYLFRRYISNSV